MISPTIVKLPLTTREEFQQKVAYYIRQHQYAQQISEALHTLEGCGNERLKAVATGNVWITEQVMNYIVGEFQAFEIRLN